METKTETATPPADAWRNFSGDAWKREIDVRDFIATNVTPYSGGPEFLTASTPRRRFPSR